jgi:hypothetical protein
VVRFVVVRFVVVRFVEGVWRVDELEEESRATSACGWGATLIFMTLRVFSANPQAYGPVH